MCEHTTHKYTPTNTHMPLPVSHLLQKTPAHPPFAPCGWGLVPIGPGLAARLGSALLSEPRDDQGAPTSAPAPRTPELTLCPACLPGYQVSWEVYGQSSSRLTLTLNSSTHEYKIQGLSSLTTYTIDVAALTAAGAGVPTSSTISSGVPPGQYARAPVSPQPCPPGLALALSWWASLCRSHWGPLKGVSALGSVGWGQ